MHSGISVDHIWPALYPAIILGGLVGLNGRSVVAVVLGIAGGLLGALGGEWVVGVLSLSSDVARLLVTVVLTAGVAYLFVLAWRKFSHKA